MSAIYLQVVDEKTASALPLDISHGLAFYLLFVCKAIEDGSRFAKQSELLSCLTRRIVSTQLDDLQHGCYFPGGTAAGTASRLCLAYGDLGILYALLKASRLLNDTELEAQTLARLQQSSCRRTSTNTGIVDDKVLYGRAGVYLFFHSLAAEVSDPAISQATHYWQEELAQSLASRTVPTIPAFRNYYYPAMQQVSLFEGLTGSLLTQMAIDTGSKDFRNLFYLV